LRFKNITSGVAIKNLKDELNGDYYFRPSTRGDDRLTLTWKFYNSNIVHIDIVEQEKAPGANIGSKLKMSDEYYESLQEIVERYITPCNRALGHVISHPKFILECPKLEDLEESLKKEKEDAPSRIPYRFIISDKYPQYIILGYVPKDKMVKEYIKVKPKGF